MKQDYQHDWAVSPQEAIAIQKRLRKYIVLEDKLPDINYVAGVDVGFENENTITRAAVVILSLPDLLRVDQAIVRVPTVFPYVPGLLSFREAPAVLDAMTQLTTYPDVLLCDGQGIAHPRRIGIASHLGLLLDIPSIGVAKTRLVGRHDTVPNNKGNWVSLVDHDEVIGAVLCTRKNVKPLYISTGHRVSLSTAIKLVMACVTRYRLPETTRWAHRLASGQ